MRGIYYEEICVDYFKISCIVVNFNQAVRLTYKSARKHEKSGRSNFALRDYQDIVTIFRNDGDKVTDPIALGVIDDALVKTGWNREAKKDYALGQSHEEIITPIIKEYANSYKDFPIAVYQIQEKYRDELRAKSGVLRGREFGMKDMYSFHLDQKDFDNFYKNHKSDELSNFDIVFNTEGDLSVNVDSLSHEIMNKIFGG